MKPDAIAVGQRIRRLRHEMGMSQHALAAETGVNESTVCRWERGKCLPAPSKRKGLANALKSTVEDIFLNRSERIEVARDKAVSRSMKIFDDLKSPAAAVNAANNTLAQAEPQEEKSASAREEELRQIMRTARDEFFRKLARLQAEED